jgi:hypothetical protein
MFRVVVVAALASVLGTGCVSVSHVQTADTLGKGNFQFALEPGMGGAAVFSGGEGASFMYPHVDLALRYGVSERVDLGLRFGSSLAELQSKFLLTSPEDPDKAISLAPSLMTLLIGSDEETGTSYTNLALPVLVGFKTKGGSEFVLGPRLTGTRISSGDSSYNVLSVGGSVGYALRVTEGFRLMPEVGVSFPIVGAVSDSGGDSEVLSGFGNGFAQFKLGFLFGGGRPIRSTAEVPSVPVEVPEQPVAPAQPAGPVPVQEQPGA